MTYRYGRTLLHPWLFETLLITQDLVTLFLLYYGSIVFAFPLPTCWINFLSIKLQPHWAHLKNRNLSKCHRPGIHYGMHPGNFSNAGIGPLFLKDGCHYLTRQASVLGMHCKPLSFRARGMINCRDEWHVTYLKGDML